jgi:hypothetical protein
LVLADAAIVQDSCVVVGTPPYANVWTYITVVNYSLPAPVCALSFIPEPQPPDPGCEMIGLTNPVGWAGFLSPIGGADWFANSPLDCIAVGDSKGGFAFLLDPAYCCYIVQYQDATGSIMLQQEECFTCQKVPIKYGTWGMIKQLYSD